MANARDPGKGNDSDYYGHMYAITVMGWNHTVMGLEDIEDNIKMQRKSPASARFGETMCL